MERGRPLARCQEICSARLHYGARLSIDNAELLLRLILCRLSVEARLDCDLHVHQRAHAGIQITGTVRFTRARHPSRDGFDGLRRCNTESPCSGRNRPPRRLVVEKGFGALVRSLASGFCLQQRFEASLHAVDLFVAGPSLATNRLQ
jgi:hypothetical protein